MRTQIWCTPRTDNVVQLIQSITLILFWTEGEVKKTGLCVTHFRQIATEQPDHAQ
jgi:hypothetical protein